MATSGTMQGNSVTVSGGGLSGNYIFTNWQLASQNGSSNFSTINWQTYFHFNGDDSQLDNGSTGSNAGTLWANGGRVYNFSSNFSTRDLLLASGSFNIGHNNDGTQTLTINGSIAVFQSGTSSGSASWALPQIDRTPVVNSFTSSNIQQSGFTLTATTDRSCSSINFSDDNGGSYSNGGSGTSGSFTFSGLLPNTTYNCYCYGVDSQSGINSNFPFLQVTTLPSALFTALDI